MKAIIFIGPPGSGKGTQSEILRKKINYEKIVMGDLLRKEIEEATALGKKIKSIMESGNMPASETVIQILDHYLQNMTKNIILDGVPRNTEQVGLLNEVLNKHGFTIERVIVLRISNDESLNRLLNRYICKSCNEIFSTLVLECSNCKSSSIYKRFDDKEEIIKNRLKISNELNKDLANSYDNPLIINAAQNINQVADDIFNGLKH